MTVLEFLERPALAERKMNYARDKVERCRCSVQRITSVLNDNRVSSSRNVTANEDAIIRLMEAEQEYSRCAQYYEAVLEETMSMLAQIEDDTNRKLLDLYYIKHMKVSSVVKAIHISRTWFYTRQEEALKQLERLLPKEDTFVNSTEHH